MTASAGSRLRLYALLAAAAGLAALAAGRAELAALGVPFAVQLIVALAALRRPELALAFTVDRPRTLEGEQVTARLELESAKGVHRLEVELVLPPGVRLARGGERDRLLLRLRPGERRELEYGLVPVRWGGYRIGEIRLRGRDALGVVVFTTTVDARVPVRVYPQAERLRRLVPARETTPFVGNVVARSKAEGIEFADIRPFLPGDRVRSINWRASARTQTLHVNETHPERTTDVVLFIDSFVEARTADEGTIDQAVRAAVTLATAYLARRDRVGLVSFGGFVRWLTPGLGLRQRYRIVDALIETELAGSAVWKDIDVLPRRTLPPQALVIALTPLLDERTIGALLDIRGRGFDLVVVDVSPVPYVAAGRARLEQTAWRLWQLHRAALRHRYEQAGVAVVEWDPRQPLPGIVEEVIAFRRYARLVHA